MQIRRTSGTEISELNTNSAHDISLYSPCMKNINFVPRVRYDASTQIFVVDDIRCFHSINWPFV